MTPLKNIPFFKDATVPGVSEVQYNAKAEELALEVSGTGTYTIYVEGQIDMNDPENGSRISADSGNWTSIAAINLNNYNIITEGITKNGIYTIALENIQRFRINLASVDGTVTVFGRSITEGH